MELFFTGTLFGANLHFMVLTYMRKSCTHHISKLLTTSVFSGLVFWTFGSSA